MMALLLVAMPACVVEPEQEYVAITAIEVVASEASNLDVEAHLYDLQSDQLLACADLRPVDDGNVRYVLAAFFELPSSPGRFLRLFELPGKDIYLWVVEKDSGGCPAPFDHVEDDIIGRSLPFFDAELGERRVMAFEGVNHLEIGTLVRRNPGSL